MNREFSLVSDIVSDSKVFGYGNLIDFDENLGKAAGFGFGGRNRDLIPRFKWNPGNPRGPQPHLDRKKSIEKMPLSIRSSDTNFGDGNLYPENGRDSIFAGFLAHNQMIIASQKRKSNFKKLLALDLVEGRNRDLIPRNLGNPHCDIRIGSIFGQGFYSPGNLRNQANHGPHPHVEPQETAALAVPTIIACLKKLSNNPMSYHENCEITCNSASKAVSKSSTLKFCSTTSIFKLPKID
ncbi:unnamed protein product [Caenorhabditis angaria]|uniref:Uncharacterized protein n=1 Tax=Caenorhabditis angaria TaxID=860376 RepID=A0A9P1ILP8_9PELO|nr:unnamed protein product [Caenorhabditis angaria]